MHAIDLLSVISQKHLSHTIDGLNIAHLSQDTRDIRDNTLFFCIPGTQVNGHLFAADAVAKGAVVLVASEDISHLVPDTPVVYVKDVVKAMALLAKVFYGDPSEQMRMIAVTGTNGKTTISHLIDAIFQAEGHRTGMMGTIYRKIGQKIIPTKNTTPDSLTVQRTLAEMVSADVTTCMMEASSHALVLGRLWGTAFNCAVFSNLSHEHMELHQTMANYAQAKTLLFSQLGHRMKNGQLPVAVLNRDSEWYDTFAGVTAAEVVSYSLLNTQADFYADDIRTVGFHTHFTVHHGATQLPASLPMLGRFNVENALAAIAAAVTQGVSLAHAVDALRHCPGVPGRFQIIDEGQDYTAIIDFAHTPDGVDNVTRTIRELQPHRLITVLGHSGGNRDSSMRPELGRIAMAQSDFVILTSDNPRHEDPVAIAQEMLSEVADTHYEIIPDRVAAIAAACRMAQAGDVVLFAGKGPEPYQAIGDDYIPYDEEAVVRAAINNEKRGN